MALPQITIIEATLVADPELRYANNGTAIANFRVASNSRRKNQQTGQWENADSTFLTISAFNGLGENIASSFNKGDKVTITGRLKQREYEKDGQKRTVYDVTADTVSKPIPRFNDQGDTQGRQNTPQGNYGGNSGPQPSFENDEQPPF